MKKTICLLLVIVAIMLSFSACTNTKVAGKYIEKRRGHGDDILELRMDGSGTMTDGNKKKPVEWETGSDGIVTITFYDNDDKSDKNPKKENFEIKGKDLYPVGYPLSTERYFERTSD